MRKHIFAGHAQLPNGTDVYESYKFISVLMIVDIDTGTILDSDISIYNPMHKNFIVEILKGKSLDTDLEKIFKEIERTVHTPTRRALINAIQTLHNRYIIVKRNQAHHS